MGCADRRSTPGSGCPGKKGMGGELGTTIEGDGPAASLRVVIFGLSLDPARDRWRAPRCRSPLRAALDRLSLKSSNPRARSTPCAQPRPRTFSSWTVRSAKGDSLGRDSAPPAQLGDDGPAPVDAPGTVRRGTEALPPFFLVDADAGVTFVSARRSAAGTSPAAATAGYARCCPSFGSRRQPRRRRPTPWPTPAALAPDRACATAAPPSRPSFPRPPAWSRHRRRRLAGGLRRTRPPPPPAGSRPAPPWRPGRPGRSGSRGRRRPAGGRAPRQGQLEGGGPHALAPVHGVVLRGRAEERDRAHVVGPPGGVSGPSEGWSTNTRTNGASATRVRTRSRSSDRWRSPPPWPWRLERRSRPAAEGGGASGSERKVRATRPSRAGTASVAAASAAKAAACRALGGAASSRSYR